MRLRTDRLTAPIFVKIFTSLLTDFLVKNKSKSLYSRAFKGELLVRSESFKAVNSLKLAVFSTVAITTPRWFVLFITTIEDHITP